MKDNVTFSLELFKMKSFVLLLALLQSLQCAGFPLHKSELESMANGALGTALVEVNSIYAVSHLFRVTQGSITRVIPLGLNTVDLLMMFGIKETECAKTARDDPLTCTFRPGLFVPSYSCSTRVRVSGTSNQVMSLRCGHDSSSSSESSEEVFSRSRQRLNIPLVSRDPAVVPVQPGRFRHTQTGDVQPRGDTFSNHLV